MELKFDKEDIKQAVVEQCMFEMFGSDDNRIDHMYTMVKQEIKEEYKKHIHEKVIANIEEMVPPLLNELIDRPYQPMDEYGEPRGPVKTIREVMKDKMSSIWNEKVDSKDGTTSTGYYGISRIEYLSKVVVKQYFNEELNKDLSSTIKNLDKQFKDSVIENITGILERKFG